MQSTLRYAIYARKSSEEDERQAESLPDQVAVLTEFAARRTLTVSRVLEEARSAKEPNSRPVFRELVETLQRGEVDGILCWNIDRLSRNPVDSGLLAWLLQSGVIKSIRTMHREYLPEDNAVILAVETSVANQYIRDLSRNVSRGLLRKAERGWWPHGPPPGYRRNSESEEIEPDPDRFDVLQRTFHKLLSGSYSIQQVFDELLDSGFSVRGRHGASKPLRRSAFYRLLGNSFYAGEFNYNGQLYQGKHPAMISLAQFDLLQSLLGRPTRLRSARETFAYAGMIRCGKCGCMICAERKTKTFTTTGRMKSYIYYHCTGARGCPRDSVTEDSLTEQFGLLVDRCSIDPEVAALAAKVADRFVIEDSTFLKDHEATCHASMRQMHVQLDRLMEMRLSGEISAEEFSAERVKRQSRLSRIESSLQANSGKRESVRRTVHTALTNMSDLRTRFRFASPTDRRDMVGGIAKDYFLTLGNLTCALHPAVEQFVAFELPKISKQQVQRTLLVPNNPILRAVRNVIRTLMTGHDNCFGESTKFAAEDKLPKTGTNQ